MNKCETCFFANTVLNRDGSNTKECTYLGERGLKTNKKGEVTYCASYIRDDSPPVATKSHIVKILVLTIIVFILSILAFRANSQENITYLVTIQQEHSIMVYSLENKKDIAVLFREYIGEPTFNIDSLIAVSDVFSYNEGGFLLFYSEKKLLVHKNKRDKLKTINNLPVTNLFGIETDSDYLDVFIEKVLYYEDKLEHLGVLQHSEK